MEQKTEATGGTVTPRAHDPDHSRLDLGCRRPGRQAGARALPVSDGQPGVLRFGESLRAVLKARPNIRIEIYNEYLDSARFPDERHPRRLADDRIAQEALRNVNKHSSARHARVELYGSPGAVHLGVADDGAGFDPGSAIARGGLGLVSMRERLRTGARRRYHRCVDAPTFGRLPYGDRMSCWRTTTGWSARRSRD